MSQSLTLAIDGLFTSPNPFSSAPPGGLLVADDVSIDQPNLATPRRGFIDWTTLPITTDRLTRLDYYQGTTDSKPYIVGAWANGSAGYVNNGSWTAFSGTYADPDPILARCRFFQTNKNLYLTTANGVYKTSSIENDPPRLAGVPQGLDVQLSFTSSSSDWFGWNPQGTFSGTTVSSSTTLTIPGSLTMPPVAIGNYVSGTGISVGTKISAITQPGPAAQTTVASTSVGATTITVTSATGIAVGQFVQDYTGTIISAGTTVTGIASTTVTLSSPVKATSATTIGVSFTSPGTLTLSQAATASATVTITYGFGSQVAYRVLWGYTDANQNLLLGAPSQYVSIANTSGGNGKVTITSTIPAGVTTGYFYQVYRSLQTSTDGIIPADTMQLVYQGNPSSGDLINGYIQVTDVQPEALKGQALYTGADQQGIGQSYYQPPVCKDACTFYGYTLYAAPTFPQALQLTFLGIGSPNGVQVGDTITIGGITFTAGNSQNIGTNTFQVTAPSGSITPAQAISATVNSFLQVVNQSATSTVYAYLISGPTDLPGQVNLVVRSPGGSAFVVTASAHGTAYSPALPTSGTTVTSTAASYPNGVLASVQNQAEAAPILNLLPLIGSATAPIRRIIPLRDRVAVLKDDGAFFITGTTLQNFVILPIDYTTQILAPDSAVVLNNEVWCLCTTGVVAVSDTGVKQESFKNVNNFLTTIFGTAYAVTQQYAFGIAYQADHKYVLSIPSGAGDVANSQVLVYNVFTNAWVRWNRTVQAGFVSPGDGKLYLGNSRSNSIVQERKAFDYTDYVDESSASPTILSVDSTGYVITLNSVSNINVGDLLYQGSTMASPILAIDAVNVTVTVRDIVSWNIASATIYQSIKCNIQWKPQVAISGQYGTSSNPGLLRQYSEGDIFLSSARFSNATMSFFTDLSFTVNTVPLKGTSATPWGLFVWGGPGIPWGDVTRAVPVRFLVPTNDQVCSQINPSFSTQEAWASWALTGLNLVYESIGEELNA